MLEFVSCHRPDFPEKTSRPSCVCVCVCAVCHMSDLHVCPEAMMERLFMSLLFRLPGRRAAAPAYISGFSELPCQSRTTIMAGGPDSDWLVLQRVGEGVAVWRAGWMTSCTICLLFLTGSPHFGLLPLILCFSVTGECCCDWQKQNPVFRKQP